MNPIQIYTQNNNIQNNSSEVCPICLDNLNNNHIHKLSECNHTFHSNCLIVWLRNNSDCPLCRGTTNKEIRSEGMILRDILNFCRSKKNKCKKLKRMYKNYEKYRDLYKINKNKLNKFRKENKEFFNTYRKLKLDTWRSLSKLLKIKREISCIPIQPINR